MKKPLLSLLLFALTLICFQASASGDNKFLEQLDAQIESTPKLKLTRTYLISQRLYVARNKDNTQVLNYGPVRLLKNDVGIIVGVNSPRTVEYHFVPGKQYELYVFADADVVRSLSLGLEKRVDNRWQELSLPASECDMAGAQAVCLQRALAVREEGDYRIRVGVNAYLPGMKAAHYGVVILERKDETFVPSSSQFTIYKRGKEFTEALEDAELNQEIVLADIDLLANDKDGRSIERPMSSQFSYGVIVFADTTVIGNLSVKLQRQTKDKKGNVMWATEKIVNAADPESRHGLWIFAVEPKADTQYRIAYNTEGLNPDESRYVGVIVYHENREANKTEIDAASKLPDVKQADKTCVKSK